MEKEDIIKVVNDVKNQPNKILVSTLIELEYEFNQTKNLIVELTRHLDEIEKSYNLVNNELNSRMLK